MKPVATQPARLILATVVLVAVLVVGQALAAVSAPLGGVASTGRLIGQTGFAYLGGLRTFAAAVLWARLEPLFHGYYDARQLKELDEFLPTMRLVQTLDPQFEQAYYNAAWILARRGNTDEAFTVAREGVANNPSSGLLRANYVGLLLLDNTPTHLEEALANAEFGLSSKARWASFDDQFEGYAVFRTVYAIRGDQAQVDRINAVLDKMAADGVVAGQDDDGDRFEAEGQ